MRLIDYLDLKRVTANKWAKEVGLPVSGVYAWIAGTTIPTIENIMKIRAATSGAVGPEDWVDGGGPGGK